MSAAGTTATHSGTTGPGTPTAPDSTAVTRAALPLAGVDLAERIAHGAWEVLREGVEIQTLYRAAGQPTAALLRYAPGATVPAHRHAGAEFILMLAGSQRDAAGVTRAGRFQVNPPGSTHDLVSDEGCVLFIVWAAPVEFL